MASTLAGDTKQQAGMRLPTNHILYGILSVPLFEILCERDVQHSDAGRFTAIFDSVVAECEQKGDQQKNPYSEAKQLLVGTLSILMTDIAECTSAEKLIDTRLAQYNQHATREQKEAIPDRILLQQQLEQIQQRIVSGGISFAENATQVIAFYDARYPSSEVTSATMAPGTLRGSGPERPSGQ